MSHWRILVLALLIAAPFLFLVGYGSYQLWLSGLSFWVWWPMAASLMLAYLLAWHWQRKQRLLRVDFTPPVHWTDRDQQAWQLVEARAREAAKIEGEKLSDVQFYVQTAQDMALELARFYHPGAKDPVGQLTVPEMLAVVELAAHDMAELVNSYLPAGHLLTVNDWRKAKKVADFYTTASKVYWAISAIFSPVNTAMRYVASELGMSRPLQALQQNLLLWFYTAYIHRIGNYLIDLNSGRLRIGAERYRQLIRKYRQPGADEDGDPAERVRQVTLTLMGQVKAGKSSLINALLGEQRAQTDVLPATAEITPYELRPAGIPTQLRLLDTVGYGHEGPRQDQLKVTREAARDSDLLLLVLHAVNPARKADLEMLQALRKWFNDNPDLKMPRVLAVLTHIDLLSPAMEWQPPYNWQEPQRPKERSIAEAVATVREQLGDYLAGVVPVCTAPGKVNGVEEGLLPALAGLLDEAHAVALLRCLRAEVDTGKIRRIFSQLLAAGKGTVQALWDIARK